MAKRGPKTPEGKAKALENLKNTMWKKGESGNPEGRPRSVLAQMCDRIGVDFQISLSKEDKFTVLESMIEMSINDLKSIALDNDAPAFMVMVASAIRSDITQGRLTSMQVLFDRFFGKPEQKGEMINRISVESEEELLAEIDAINEALKKLD